MFPRRQYGTITTLLLICGSSITNAFVSPSARNNKALHTPATHAAPNSITTKSRLDLIDDSSIIESSKDYNLILHAIQSEQVPFQYAFMLPTMTLIATCCQLAGIGGAALLSPLFLLVFPLLQLPSTPAASAIASALLTEVFGFASGLTGYWRRGLVDRGIAGRYLLISMPCCFLGANWASTVASNVLLLRGVYAALMLGLAAYLILSKPQVDPLECETLPLESEIRTKQATDGTVYEYKQPPLPLTATAATSGGAFLTGLLGVGIGEVVLPQLVRLGCLPLPMAAGTSVAVVVVTALTAAVIQFLALVTQVTNESTSTTTLAEGLIQVIPWSLVQFTIPGALLGGQLAPLIASAKTFKDETIERFAATLFGLIGIAFALKCLIG
jgi:uncharacterized membrane protein YfcA